MAQLIPPSNEERELYYFGLPSCPKLVARSSSGTEPWVNPQRPEPTMFTGTMNMYPRIFLPAEDGEKRAILVAKYGARTGLTLGLSNELVSVVRRPGTADGEMSEEWCITSAGLAVNKQALFSDGGDSGSCIWDMDGRIAGILMAGAGINGLNDVTYAQPFERLLTDIRAHGFEVSLI
ncbi:uncharacterized protein TrAtP1_009652 [Trichoderma atroviride]|uniref:uncharacterized protein n=1 Tax=Hypocrea atroviridis TaxID=63577 RepID=UPI003329C984|nr:hypothetical protein TrAtP1_009652 [Trichoderma atroviride]